GSGFTSNAIRCIDFAIANGARVLSNSWGGSGADQLLLEAIQRARDAGVLFCAAAGNGGNDGIGDNASEYPAAYNASSSNVLSVAATTRTDRLASFSNYGSTVDLAAPGQEILSTVPNGNYASYSGTSMATPCVAGAAALALAANPALTLAQLKAALLNSLDTPASLAG